MGMEEQLLVIDDDAGIRESLSLAFAGLCRVLTASTIAEGLALLHQNPIDLVVLDYCLPDGPGTRAIRLVKTHWPSIPVIVITGYGSESLCAEFLRLGARAYFPKPYDLGSLMLTVKRLLEIPKTGTRENVLAALPTRQPDKNFDLPAGIERALLFIRANYTEPITLDQVAREAAMSLFHFCRTFKAALGVGVYHYVLQLRVEKAKQLLRDPQLTVAEVAFEAGFTDLSSFYRVFRLMTGQRPGEWRRVLVPAIFPS